MAQLIVILGGTRSGKSRLGRELLREERRVAYLATADANDAENADRIERHRDERPKSWRVYEEPKEFPQLFRTRLTGFKAVILDGTSSWLASLFPLFKDPSRLTPAVRSKTEKQMLEQVEAFLKASDAYGGLLVVVADEMGQGMVPSNALARLFRDVSGLANQLLVARADEAYLAVAGRKVRIK